MPPNHLILCHPFLLLPSTLPSIRVFFWQISCLLQVAKVLELQLNNCLSDEYSGLISCRIDWFDLLSVQGTLKSLLQNWNSKASILWHSAFFMIQLAHLYMTTAGCQWIKVLGVKAGNNQGWPTWISWAGISLQSKNFTHPWILSDWIHLLLRLHPYWNSLWSWASEGEILLDSSSIWGSTSQWLTLLALDPDSLGSWLTSCVTMGKSLNISVPRCLTYKIRLPCGVVVRIKWTDRCDTRPE